jgi:hypothetical protein
MGMRETSSSMSAYLILSGLLAALSYGSAIVSSQGSPAGLLGIAGLGISMGYLYIGLRFKHLIRHAPGRVLGMLKIGGAFLALMVVLALAGGAGLTAVPGVGAGLLITYYLFVNARRIANELNVVDSGTSLASAALGE